MPQNPKSMDFGPSTQQFDTQPNREALPAGTTLGGYQIIDVLGRGGFGIVYLALDSSLQRQVAIKEFFPAELALRCDDMQVWLKPGADATGYAMGKTAFLNEAKMLARFDHPALARVHSFWEDNRTAYMVMPYYEGPTLGATLAGMSAPPDEAWLRKLLDPLLSGLAALHAAQCLHLDISPDNILVQPDGRPVLLDFGVSNRQATDKTLPITALLNPAYAPIEQYSEAAGLMQGPWTDLYALAAVLHRAITGQPPARSTVRAVEDPQRPLAETVAVLRERHPGLHYSASFLAAIDRALAVKPRERPRDVAEFQRLMDRGASTPPHAAPPPAAPPAARAQDWEPDRPRAAPATAAGARREPLFEASMLGDARHDDSGAHAPSSRRRRASWWVGGLFAIGLLGVSAWAWTHRQPALAEIGVADLPASVVARIPKARVASEAGQPAAAAPASVAMAGSSAGSSIASSAASSAASVSPSVASASPTFASASATATVPATAAAASSVMGAASTPAPAWASASTPAPAITPAPRAEAQPTKLAAAAAEPNNPRAVCGNRSNFALLYCMQTQCKRPKFTQHPQCLEARRRGDIN